MCSLLAKRAFSFLPSSSHLAHHHFRLHDHCTPLIHALLRLSLSTQTHQSEDLPFLAQYLISSFGFSPDQAIKVSTNKYFRAINSSEQADSVVAFLKEIGGFSDSEIRRIIQFKPKLLRMSVDKTIKPQCQALIDAGCTREMFTQMIRSNPQCLYVKNTLSRFQFWKSFIGKGDDAMVKILQRNTRLLSIDIDKRVVPSINLLHDYGLFNKDIVCLLVCGSRIMFRNLESLRQVLERTEELGFPPGSAIFRHALRWMSSYSKETLDRKGRFFKRKYGWSEEEFSSALKQSITMLSLSEENIGLKMDFLINHAGYEPRSISHQSHLLSYSLSRVMSRHKVLHALQAKGLKKTLNLLSTCVLSEKRFLERYVLPYETDLPGLTDTYVAACHQMVQKG